MFELGPGRRPGNGYAVGALATALMLAVVAGGCSSTRTAGTSSDQWYAADGDYRVAYQPPPPKVDVEDDGIEAQAPPLRRSQQEPDDPSEPFSPNYGGPPLHRQAEAVAAPRATVDRAAVPSDLPSDFRRRLTLAAGD